MSASVSDGPAIVAGYEYRLQLEADSPVFPEGCSLTAQVRARVSENTVIATLTTANGGLARISDTVVEIVIPPAATAKVELAPQTGPIRIRVSGTEQVRVRVSSVPVTVRVLGTPGPTGPPGGSGPPGPQGPPGNLETGITIDGGNF